MNLAGWRRILVVALVVGVVTGGIGYVVAGIAGPGDDTSRVAASASPSTSASATPKVDPVVAAAEKAYARLSPEQRVGQLFMIGVTSTAPTPVQLGKLKESYGGNVFLRGRSDLGVGATKAITDRLVTTTRFAGVRPFISADQEGGGAQGLAGDGFEAIPSAVQQGQLDPPELRRRSAVWGKDLLAAGVNLDLGPVADVVPADVGTANAPIGSFYRQYGSDPTQVAPHVGAFVRGMTDAGVVTAVKHFPGLGRATGNTDSDPTATDPTRRGDPFLEAFRGGVRAKVPFVMVSSANYPNIDPANRACFSTVVLRSMIRNGQHFKGVVISDSFGSASVASVPAGPRAVKFFEAGGTMLLDTNWLDLKPMTAAVLQRAGADSDFAAVVKKDVLLVLQAKSRAGLLS